MEFTYRYNGSSTVASTASTTGLSFAPDTYRQPTYFSGLLAKRVPFREAISALHDVVISDHRFKPRDLTVYKEWLKSQEDFWVGSALGDAAQLRSRIDTLREELRVMDRESQSILRPFYDARTRYWKYLYEKNRSLWILLDPVITVHPDELFFECFSRDESVYGKLSCGYEVFESVGDFECGTTNIDYSDNLYAEFQKIRDYKKTRFEIDPSGFEVHTTSEDSFNEVKIDVPDSWVRGFLQVSSAMTLDGVTFDLHPLDVHNFCFVLRRLKEKHGPRGMRYRLKPGEPVKVVFEPWNLVVECRRSIYNGPEEREIRLWGRRRLLILERLLPLARSFTVHLLGTGLPSFYIANLGDMAFTLGLSGWTANDWSRAGQFDLLAPRRAVDGATQERVFAALKETWRASADELSRTLQLDRDVVLGALQAYTQAGRAIYDLDKRVYRVRELSREPLPMSKLRFSSEREERATKLVNENAVTVKVDSSNRERTVLKGTVKAGKHTHTPELTIDADDRLTSGTCTCNFFTQNKMYKGPCECMLATRMAWQRAHAN